MRKVLFVVGLFGMLALSSCKVKEEYHSPTTPHHFRAVIEQLSTEARTRVYVDKDIFDESEGKKYSIFWYRNDRVSIFENDTYNREHYFGARDGSTAGDLIPVDSGSSSTTAQELSESKSYAIFPYHKDNRCDTEGNLTVVIPEKQEYYSPEDDYRGIGARLLMVAVDATGNREFFFKHVGCYIGIRLKGENVSVKSLSFCGNNSEIIAGYPIVTFEDNDPVMHFDPRDRDNSTSIKMELPNPVELKTDDYTYFWIIVPPITFENAFTLIVENEQGETFTKVYSGKWKAERKMFYTLSVNLQSSTSVTSVSLDKEELALTVGEEVTLSATVLPDNATDKTVTWSSSNENVATVDENGKVTAIAAGEATITVTTTDGEKTANCVVTVTDEVSYSLSITPAEAAIIIGDSQTYVVKLKTIRNGEPTETEVADAVLTVNDGAAATVNGLQVTGVKEEVVTVTAKYKREGSEEITATANLTVNKKPNQAGDPTPVEGEEEL